MKITGDPLQYCGKLPASLRGIVLYGPNALLIQECIGALRRQVLADSKDDLAVVTVTADRLKQNPTLIADELSSFGFFAAKKLIHIREADDAFVKPLQEALTLPAAGHFIVLEAGELGPKTALRIWAEKAADIAAVACYMLEGAALQRFVQARFQEQNARIANDALALLVDRLGNELGPLKQIINQLIDFVGEDQPMIHVEHIEALLIDQAEQSLDQVTQALADGRMPQLDRALQQLAAEGTSMIAVLRALQAYFYRLRTVQLDMQHGLNFDNSIKKLKPPLFFKAKPAFSKHLRQWNLLRIDSAIARFLALEAECKKTGIPELEMVQQSLITLAQENAVR